MKPLVGKLPPIQPPTTHLYTPIKNIPADCAQDPSEQSDPEKVEDSLSPTVNQVHTPLSVHEITSACLKQNKSPEKDEQITKEDSELHAPLSVHEISEACSKKSPLKKVESTNEKTAEHVSSLEEKLSTDQDDNNNQHLNQLHAPLSVHEISAACSKKSPLKKVESTNEKITESASSSKEKLSTDQDDNNNQHLNQLHAPLSVHEISAACSKKSPLKKVESTNEKITESASFSEEKLSTDQDDNSNQLHAPLSVHEISAACSKKSPLKKVESTNGKIAERASSSEEKLSTDQDENNNQHLSQLHAPLSVQEISAVRSNQTPKKRAKPERQDLTEEQEAAEQGDSNRHTPAILTTPRSVQELSPGRVNPSLSIANQISQQEQGDSLETSNGIHPALEVKEVISMGSKSSKPAEGDSSRKVLVGMNPPLPMRQMSMAQNKPRELGDIDNEV